MAEMLKNGKVFPANDRLGHFRKVLEVLGTPGEACISRMGPAVRSLVLSLPCEAGKPLESLFPDCTLFNSSSEAHFQPASARDLLSKMLVFDPANRISVQEALDHPFVSSFRCHEDVHAVSVTARHAESRLLITTKLGSHHMPLSISSNFRAPLR